MVLRVADKNFNAGISATSVTCTELVEVSVTCTEPVEVLIFQSNFQGKFGYRQNSVYSDFTMTIPEHPTVQLSKALYTSSRLLIQQIQTHLNEFGLTYPQFLALSILWKEDGLKVHELGNRMSLDSGTLTPLLKKLESQNLLKRKRGEADERTVTINLTYPGKSLQSKVMESIKTMEKDFASTLGKQTGELLSAAEEFLEKLKSIGSGGPTQTV